MPNVSFSLKNVDRAGPTFPIGFVKDVLVGGARDLQALIYSGELRQMLPRRAWF